MLPGSNTLLCVFRPTARTRDVTGDPGIIALFVFSKYLIYLMPHCTSFADKNVAIEILYRMVNYAVLKLFQICLKKYEK